MLLKPVLDEPPPVETTNAPPRSTADAWMGALSNAELHKRVEMPPLAVGPSAPKAFAVSKEAGPLTLRISGGPAGKLIVDTIRLT